MKSRIIIAVLGFALAAAPILAQDNSGNAPAEGEQAVQAQAAASNEAAATATTQPDPGEEIICRRDRATGSLTRVNRVCKTRNEWNGTYDRTRDNLNDLQRNASGGRECRQDAMGGC